MYIAKQELAIAYGPACIMLALMEYCLRGIEFKRNGCVGLLAWLLADLDRIV